MSIIIRLQNLPWAANALDIRQYFSGLQIPEGGVHIVGGELGDAFIAFSTDEDARQAFLRNDGKIKGIQIKLLLSSRTEMQRVIEQARTQSMAAFMLPTSSTAQMPAPVPAAVPAIVPASVPEIRKDNGDDYSDRKRERRRSRSKSRERRDKSRDRRERRRDRGRSKSREKRDKRRGRSKEGKTRSRDRDRNSRRDKGRNSDNRDLDREDKKPQDIWVNRQQPVQPTLNIIPPPGIIQNDVPSLLGPWGFGSAAKTNDVVAALAANLQVRNVNGFQPPQADRPRPLMETRYGEDWSNRNPPLLNEPYGFRNRLDFTGLQNLQDNFEPPRRSYGQEEDESNGDFRGGFGSRRSQPEVGNAKKSRFEPPFKEKSFGGRKSRFDDADGPPVNACVSLEPFEGSYGDLRRFFSKLPINYRGIKVINDKYGQKTGMCYVQFKEERFKNTALEMDGMEFNGEKVSIRHISDKEYEDAIDRYNPKMDELNPQAAGRNNEILKKPPTEDPPEIQDFTCLKVEGLPTLVKEQDILHIFSQYPLICLLMDVKPKGGTVAYVKFGSQEVAKQALKERAQHVINGKSVAVKPCLDEEFELINQKQPNIEPDKIVSDCLLISNLPLKSNDRDISDFFSDIGLIPTKIHLLSNNEGFTGQAYCEFESTEEAEKAATKDETLMGPNKVSVKLLLREDMERVLNSSLPHPGLGPGETLAPGTPLPPIPPEIQPEPETSVEETEKDEPMPLEEEKFQPQPFPPRPLLSFVRPGYLGPRFPNMLRGRFDPNLGPRGPFGRGGMRGKFDPRGGFRGRGRFPPPRGRFPPPNHRTETPPSDVQPGCTVYMDNVPFKAGTNEILDFFEGYNCTNEVSRMYNNDHTPSALAKVTFYNSEDAEKAVRELNGEKIWNRPITLTQE